MTVLRVVLGDQCTPGLSALHDLHPATDTVLMVEAAAECTYVPHHPKKIVLVLSAMRHFARALQARDVRVAYVRLDDPANTGTLRDEVLRACARLRPDRIICTEPGEWRVLQDMQAWHAATGVPCEIRDDTRFVCSIPGFRAWAQGRTGFRMDGFYRAMRLQTGLLVRGTEPEGGQWSYDRDNRKPLPPRVAPPPPPGFPPDAITQEVMALVAARFAGHFGSVDGFAFPVTGRDARLALADFVQNRLAGFGDWQDAMRAGQGVLFHALISTSLNTGLLSPLEACRAAEAAYHAGLAPLNAAEGFVRQIIGWREFVRGVYWLRMPGYGALNALDAVRPLPALYWDADTRMNCLRHAVSDTRAHAYAHHIQRLMVLGNFALLAGLHPDEVCAWFLAVYADAYEWVELPNVRGMALYGDGGFIGSKPYASSGAYINRMSDYCHRCHYDARRTLGRGACPFNALYWDFLARHRDALAGNPRMAGPMQGLARMDPERVAALRAQAAGFLAALDAGERV